MNFTTKEDELIAVRKWLLEVNAILKELALRIYDHERQLRLDSLERGVEAIHRGFEKKNLRGLKMMMRDNLEELRDLTPDQAIEVDRRLCEKSGIGLKTVQKAILKKVKEILKRGKVETADEYRILQTRADEISADSSKKKELDKIIDVLSAVKGTLDD